MSARDEIEFPAQIRVVRWDEPMSEAIVFPVHHPYVESLSVRCGPGVGSPITRIQLGRVVSDMACSFGGRDRRSSRASPTRTAPARLPARCGRARPYWGGVDDERPVNPKGSAPSEASGLDRTGASTHPPHPPPKGRQRNHDSPAPITLSPGQHTRPHTRPLIAAR